jgi:ATP adenylyltransferase
MRIIDKNRAKYGRSYAKSEACPFCADDEVLVCPGLAGKSWRVLVNRFPYMDGNVMIVPVRHVERTDNLTAEEWVEFGTVLSKTQEVLGKIFKMNSFNIGMNLGSESGASIAHLHWQVIPRKFKNITVANTFADLYIVAVTPEETKRLIDEETKTKG